MDLIAQLRSSLLDRYDIERKIGQGGMAVVYLARDLRHDRPVAVKVLNPDLAAVVGKERFLAEIRVTARLQHPHLLPLFDSGEADGQLFYVMPFVQGESLRDRINREKQLPIEEAIRIAVAVGGALDHAHRQGVIHRDLKPENILLQDGQPLVADFGIALAVSVAGGARITQTGLSLGTPQYMSPEQATGDRAMDGRTDIYSLAAVLYEMLTGDPPHTGSTAQAIIAKVITDKPRPIRLARETVPDHVSNAVECALAKLPADRFATAHAFVDALQGKPITLPAGARTPASVTTDPMLRAARRRIYVRNALVLASVAVVAAVAARLSERRPAPPAPMRFVLEQGTRFALGNPAFATTAITRDGSRIAYTGRSDAGLQIFVRDLDGADARPVPGTEGGVNPTLSPDGKHILFNDGRLRRVPVEGGTPVTVSDSGVTPSWGDNDVIVFYVAPGKLYQTTSEGGTPRLVARVGRAEGVTTMNFPHLLPGGEAALVTVYRGTISVGSAYLGAIRLRDGKFFDLQLAGGNPLYANGHVFLSRQNGTIVAARFDPRRLRVLGPPVTVLENVIVRPAGASEFAIADNGTIVYRSGPPIGQLVSVDLRGFETRIPTDPRIYSGPRYSPDGKRIAVAVVGNARPDTWIFDSQSGVLTRLTQDGGDRPIWTADGRSVLTLTSDTTAANVVRSQPWDASGAPVTFMPADRQVNSLSFPRSGRGYFAARVGAPQRDIWIAPVDSPQALRPFLTTPAEEMMPSVSADGRWLAYVSNESGPSEVYVRPMPGPGARIQISAAGGMEPLWSPRENAVFYRGSGKIMRARLANLTTTPSVTREALFDDVYASTPVHTVYDVSPDGTKLLFVKSAGAESKTIVIVNWLTELERRMNAARP